MENYSRSESALPQPIQGLVYKIESYGRPLSPNELTTLLSASNVDLKSLQDWIRFDEVVYSRNKIISLPNAELLVMCWRAGQLSPIHNHKGSACGVKVVQGECTEIVYERATGGLLVPTKRNTLVAGEIASSFDEEIHQIANLEEISSDLVTLHCYSPPLTKMEIFSESKTFFAGYSNLYREVNNRIQKNSIL